MRLCQVLLLYTPCRMRYGQAHVAVGQVGDCQALVWHYPRLGASAPSGRKVPKRVFSIQYSVFFAIVTLSVIINCK